MFLAKCNKCSKEWIYGVCCLDIGAEIKQAGQNQFQVTCGNCVEQRKQNDAETDRKEAGKPKKTEK